MTHNIHDIGYKRLFGNKTIFRQLIETFVEEDWVQELDFDQATPLDKSFVSDHYKETESDIIYSVPLLMADGTMQDVFFYILVEFQSTVQRFMVLRMLHYVTGFYLDFLHTHGIKSVKKLPAILPIVLYNGEERWTAPENIADLIEDYPPLGKYRPDFEYLKLIENEYSKEGLLKTRNIVTLLFLVEAYYDIELLQDELLALYDDDEMEREALYIFLNWFKQLAIHGRIDEDEYGSLEQTIADREEVQSMLLKALEREKAALREEGREEGVEKALKRGLKSARLWQKIAETERLFSQ